MRAAALGLALAVSGLAGAEPASYGPFGVVGRVSVETDVPKAPIAFIVNAGLAATEDGAWLRLKPVWRDGRVVAVEQLESLGDAEARAAGWSVPGSRRLIALPNDLPGEQGCRLISAAVATRGRLGAWNCDSADGTLLGGLGKGGQPVVLARLPRRYQAMSAEPTLHGGGDRVLLAAYDVATRRFDWLELAIGPK